MPSCSIKNCKNNTRNAKNRNITFLGFPRKTEMIEKWKVFCKENINPTSARVCSEHFLPGQFEDKTWLKNLVGDSGRVSKKLLPDAVPMASIVDHSVNTELSKISSVAQESDAMLLLKEENRKLKKALAASVSETKLLKRRLATINKRQKKIYITI